MILCLVIAQCALERDLKLFDAGDQTEVGEKGITLRYPLPHRHRFEQQAD